MIKEKYTTNIKETTISVSQSNIQSIRTKDITRTGIRVYKDGFIGIAGAVGKFNEDEVEKEAIENLKLEIPYPYEPESNKSIHKDYRKEVPSNKEFLEEAEDILSYLRENYPNFTFSNNMYIQESLTKLENTQGLDLSYMDRMVMVGLIIKDNSSINVFDAFSNYIERSFNKEQIIKSVTDILEAYENVVELPKVGKYPVIFNSDSMIDKILKELDGYRVGTGASLFKDFIGKKKFSDKFTLYQGSDEDDITGYEFFDAEGVVNENDRVVLIDKGTIIRPYTDKKTAAEFNLELTGSSMAAYDKAPSIAPRAMTVESSDKNLKELLDGEIGIMVVILSGGDFTEEGVFGSPVQLAFLTDGEKLLGRLPELKISGELYTMFNEDFIGKTKEKALLGSKNLVIKLDVELM